MHIGRDEAENRDRRPLKFRQVLGAYAIVRLAADAAIPGWAANGDFTSITRTANELSIVCRTQNVPSDVDHGPCWICLKLEGPFAFSQTGILLSFIEPLSSDGIPIFAISTYDTDYVLVQEEFADAALQVLEKAGHEVIGDIKES
ncbi:MAG: ACT domain-containing protein [Candidatus Sulfotelmatobacter sp.]